MPRGNGTGPMGMGPMTGHAAGYCAGFGMPGYANLGRGFGVGFGRGRGWRNRFYATGLPGWMRFGGNVMPYSFPKPDPEMEKLALKNHAEALQTELGLIQQRLNEMEKTVSTEQS
ncbi:MAG: DUF5320 domain-containing protein [Phycisphaerae bacterium]|nr:DUF5320 domain-containing protein [Phycisphaerae bacterium]